VNAIRGLWRNNRAGAYLFLVLLLCYAYFFPRWGDWNQNSRLDLTMAVVEDHTLHIDAYAENTGDYALYEGHAYSDKAPGASFLGVPAYAAFRQVVKGLNLEPLLARLASGPAMAKTMAGEDQASVMRKGYQAAALYVVTLLTSALPSAILGVLIFDLLKTVTSSVLPRLSVALLYGWGTGAFPYANAFLGHQLAAALLFGAFYVLFRTNPLAVSTSQLLLAGCLLGYAFITEYPAILIVLPLLGYAAFRLRTRPASLVWVMLGTVPSLGLLAWYDYTIYGTVLPMGYSYSALWQAEHSTGFLSLTYPRLSVAWELLFGTYRGLFNLSPALLFAVPGFVYLWRERHNRVEGLISLVAFLAFLAFNSASCMWWGGFAVGPRYLLPALPFLVWPIAFYLRQHQGRGTIIYLIAASLSLASVWAQTLGGRIFPRYERVPLVEVSLPNLIKGNIARNLGMLMGLSGWASLLPLLLGMAILGCGLWRTIGDITVAPRDVGLSESSDELGAAATPPPIHEGACRCEP
jgi:hypothetical protein